MWGCKELSEESAARVQIQMQCLIRLEISNVWSSLAMGKKE